MSEDLRRIHDALAALFMALSPATFMAVVVVMLGLGVWVTRKGWHSRRVARAVANAPLVDLRSSAGGLVKIRGTAQPTAANPGGGPSSLIWYSRTRRSGSNSSTLATTDNSLIRDDHDVCAVNTDKTTILPSASVAKDGFLDQHTSSVGLRCADATKSKDDPTPTFGRPIRLAGSGRHPQGGFQGAAR